MKTDFANQLPRVLIADDCPDTVSLMQRFCNLLGYESLGVKNGLAAVELAQEYRPHIVIIDISMPVLDGYEAARRIRQQEGAEDLILVALTGWGAEPDKERAFEAGFTHFWLKPVDYNKMRSLFLAVQKHMDLEETASSLT